MAKSRSGTPWTDADYAAAGYARLGLRLPVTTKELLQRLADASGWSVGELMTRLAEAEEKRRISRASRKKTG